MDRCRSLVTGPFVGISTILRVAPELTGRGMAAAGHAVGEGERGSDPCLFDRVIV